MSDKEKTPPPPPPPPPTRSIKGGADAPKPEGSGSEKNPK